MIVKLLVCLADLRHFLAKVDVLYEAWRTLDHRTLIQIRQANVNEGMNEAAAALDHLTRRRDCARPVGKVFVRPMLKRESVDPDQLSRLVEAIAASQDRAAFAALFEQMGPRVKTYLMRSGTAPEVAEEIAQETMLVVWRKASYFDAARAGAATWIFTIARNLRIDWQRRNQRSEPMSPGAEEEADLSPTPEESVLASFREARVRAALGELSEEQATIVRLSFFAEKPHGEIARELGLPLGTVKSRVRLALARLRRILDEAP